MRETVEKERERERPDVIKNLERNIIEEGYVTRTEKAQTQSGEKGSAGKNKKSLKKKKKRGVGLVHIISTSKKLQTEGRNIRALRMVL